MKMEYPKAFVEQIIRLMGGEAEAFLSSLDLTPAISVRVNRKKFASPLNAEPVMWCESGYYLDERLTFTFDPLLHTGYYYVQEASSMFLEQVLKQIANRPMVCLDLCASPGGKSTHVLSLLPEGSLLVSNEPIRSRAKVLAENIAKWGASASIVLNNYPADLHCLDGMFDLILTDVPCSGEGMFRKDATAVAEWSTQAVALCAKRQRDILDEAWPLLKPGGALVYSTCTFNTEENEEQIEYLVSTKCALPVAMDTPCEWNITSSLKYNHPVYRFLPHKVKGEGFFMAVVRKPEDEDSDGPALLKKDRRKHPKQDKRRPLSLPVDWLKNPEELSFFHEGDKLFAIRKEWEALAGMVIEKLNYLSVGTNIAVEKGGAWVPVQPLLLSDLFNDSAFGTINLSYEEAIGFLRCDSLRFNEHKEKGYYRVSYQGIPIGFCKVIGNRANNMYPAEWKIKSGYLPEEVKVLTDLTDPA